MGFLKKLVKAGINTVAVPLDIGRDVLTLGGVSTDQDEPYTKQRAKKIKKALEDAMDALDD